MRLLFLISGGISIGILVGTLYFSGIESAALISQILAGPAIIFAAATFAYERIKNRTNAVLEQVEFFRSTIIDGIFHETQEAANGVKGYDTENAVILHVEKFNYLWLYVNYYDQVQMQDKLTRFLQSKNEAGKVVQMLNSLEYFSLHVLNQETTRHDALSTVRKMFVDIVEEFSATIAFHRIRNPETYANIIRLYREWGNDVYRITSEEILAEIEPNLRHLMREGEIRDFDKIMKDARERSEKKKREKQKRSPQKN